MSAEHFDIDSTPPQQNGWNFVRSIIVLGSIACLLIIVIIIRSIINTYSGSNQVSLTPENNTDDSRYPNSGYSNSAQPSTPVVNEIEPLVTSTTTSEISSSPTIISRPTFAVTANNYLVGNIRTGKIYISQNPDEVVPIASISKLVTALVARQFMDQSMLVPITDQALSVYDGKYGIGAGEKFTVRELYYPMLLQSNDAVAEAYALSYEVESQVGSMPVYQNAIASMSTTTAAMASSSDVAFVHLMNDYVMELGMTRSHFDDPSGLSEGNVSTASNLFTLAQYLYEDQYSKKQYIPDLFGISRLPSETVGTTTDHGAHTFVNINPFVNNASFIGGKTGRTNAAGETMVSIFNFHGTPIAVIVLHSDYGMRQVDTELLLAKVEAGITNGLYQ